MVKYLQHTLQPRPQTTHSLRTLRFVLRTLSACVFIFFLLESRPHLNFSPQNISKHLKTPIFTYFSPPNISKHLQTHIFTYFSLIPTFSPPTNSQINTISVLASTSCLISPLSYTFPFSPFPLKKNYMSEK